MVVVRTLALAMSLCGCDLVFGVPPPDEAAATPALVGSTSLYATRSSVPTYPATVPDGANRALIVAVQLGSNCAPPTPAVTQVSYAGLPLMRIANILGTPCGTSATRSEQWLLVDPPVGTGDVAVRLDAVAETAHVSASVFIDVDPELPVRAIATASNTGSTGTVTVTSAPGDLVFCTVGHGGGIDAPGGDAEVTYLNNVDSTNTLNNSAASTMPGGEPAVTSTWMFLNADEWQSIATSLRRAP